MFAPSVRDPWSRHCLENPTAKDLFARPGAQPSARRPPAALGGSVITGPRGASRPPARTHTVRPGTGKSGGRPSALLTPPRSRSRAPSKPHRVRPASVRGPWSRHRLENPTAKALFARPGAQSSARHPPAARGGSVITGPRGASCPPARTHAVGPGTGKSGGGPSALATPACWPARAGARLGGRGCARWLGCPCPCPARGSLTGAARLRMGGEGECARTGDSNPSCNYPVSGYSPSLHFFWGGDVPHYSPLLFFS